MMKEPKSQPCSTEEASLITFLISTTFWNPNTGTTFIKTLLSQ